MGKGSRSSIQQKVTAARKRMYTPNQYLAYQRCGCDPKGFMPSDDMIEAIEMKKLTGGFDMSRSNQCGTCFQVKSVNGKCSMGCDEDL
jgi:hypothetical protein